MPSVFQDPAPWPEPGWRRATYRVIFGHDTRAGLYFDLWLIAAILFSVAIALIDSVGAIHRRHAELLYALEWSFTLLFTAEYVLRLLIVEKPGRYARSLYGIIDLLAVLPTYASLLVAGTQYLLVIRLLRILRVFRLLKLTRYVSESGLMVDALLRSRRKILVFVIFMLTLVTVFGALMYLIEGPDNGFTSIPMSMYWAIVTVATVGFGDIAPVTPAGRLVTSMLVLIGYGIIAVPTGIYTAELMNTLRASIDHRECRRCGLLGHLSDARYCRRCGERFSED
ncbi:MAG: ion transporter [Porticoccaceae bacterium]|jgi:voltage-gated potassium channel|nr:ion transporter [Porticoccaceae bacterium]